MNAITIGAKVTSRRRPNQVGIVTKLFNPEHEQWQATMQAWKRIGLLADVVRFGAAIQPEPPSTPTHARVKWMRGTTFHGNALTCSGNAKVADLSVA